VEYGNPPEGINPAPGETAPQGCVYEWVPPTSGGGATCDHIECVCEDGTWQEQTGGGFGCLP
jgi:hypothetical protein